MSLPKRFFFGLVVGVPVAVTFHDTVGSPAAIVGSSMRPTFNPQPNASGDVVWLNKWRCKHQTILPGHVIAFRSPTNPNDLMVKRVIATSGHLVCTRGYKTHFVEVPRGHLWVEGDNMKTSKDSNVFGPISEGLVEGRVNCVIWPPRRWRRIEHSLLATQIQRTQK